MGDAVAHDPCTQAHEVREVGGDAVEVMGRDDDGESVMVELTEQVENSRGGCERRRLRWVRRAAADLGCRNKARAMKTRCCWPPDSSRMWRCARPVETDAFENGL